MDRAELDLCISEIRGGRSEDTTLDWKRAWWPTGQNGSREFLKDISAMANAALDGPRHILIGVGERGQLHDAALPEDEANLQQRLLAITPTPCVRFVPHTWDDGLTICSVTILPPFNPPHVVKVGNDHFIWLRSGSSTFTATRAHLDRWYSGNRDRATERRDRAVAAAVVLFEHLVTIQRRAEKGGHTISRWNELVLGLRKAARDLWLVSASAPDLALDVQGVAPVGVAIPLIHTQADAAAAHLFAATVAPPAIKRLFEVFPELNHDGSELHPTIKAALDHLVEHGEPPGAEHEFVTDSG